MTSPIASAHAIFAFDLAGRNEYSDIVDWRLWILSTLPIALLTAIVSFLALFLVSYLWSIMGAVEEKGDPEYLDSPLISAHYHLDSRSKRQLSLVMLLHIATIIFWVLSGYYSEWTGELGIVSIIPVIVLFGSGLLDQTHLSKLPWHIILLAIGGSALQIAAKHSGYLQHVSSRYINNLHWTLFILVPTFFSLYKSQFVTSLLFIPAVIASNQDAQLSSREGAIRFMMTFVGSSLGMALPISTMTGLMLSGVVDGGENRRLRTVDFIIFGITGTVAGFIVSVSCLKPLLEVLIK
jgi:phosphate transporter